MEYSWWWLLLGNRVVSLEDQLNLESFCWLDVVMFHTLNPQISGVNAGCSGEIHHPIILYIFINILLKVSIKSSSNPPEISCPCVRDVGRLPPSQKTCCFGMKILEKFWILSCFSWCFGGGLVTGWWLDSSGILWTISLGNHNWLVVEPTHLKNISQIGLFPQIGMKIECLERQHLQYL